MNKSDFIDAVVKKTGAKKKDAMAFVNAYHEIVTDTLSKGDNVSFTGFGAYSAEHVAARKGNNPATGEKISIPARIRPKFKAGKSLKDALNVVKSKAAKKGKAKK